MQVEIKIKTLTPIWTGGVDGTMDRIHETGIIGSLRWWYEVLVRGLGGNACDPTEHTCGFDQEKYRKSKASDERQRLRDAGLCDVCQVFGATGWRRRFRLEVEDETRPIWEPAERMLNVRPPGRNRGWFLPPGRMGTVTLKLSGDAEVLSRLATLLLFLERWGSLGAKPQLGYGVFQIENREEVKARVDGWKWETMGNGKPNGNLPELRQLGFFRLRFSVSHPAWWTKVGGLSRVASEVQPVVREYATVPVAPVLKNEWRFSRWKGGRNLEKEIFGALQPERKRSRVVASWAYRTAKSVWEVRGWVWLASPKWADPVWDILSEAATWEAVLRVKGTLESGRLTTEEAVRNLLEDI